ncbi:MAG: hypothetical protein Q7U51_04140 [Methanoregula sp.]|nr:hypothetical protein [Methanoregula sp.]
MDTMDTISGYSGKSYEKIVHKKDPGTRENGVHGARNGTAHSPKISGTCPVRCPLMFRAIVKRHAMTGLKVGLLRGDRPAPGFRRGRVGPGPSGSGVVGVLSGTAPISKRSGTCPVRCPFL